MLSVIEYIRTQGLAALADELKIAVTRHQQYPNLVHLKYNAIESPMADPVVQECRGLILDESANWRIVAFPYTKFFNYGEEHAASIDWSTACVQEKLDGSLMYLYFYGDRWNVSSSGVPDASGRCGTGNPTFAEMFWAVWEKLGYRLPQDVGYTFCFEMMTALNRVVVPVRESRIVLHGVRNMATLCEESPVLHAQKNGWEVVRSFPLNSIDAVVAAAASLDPMVQEGYVVVDCVYNRVKVKGPAYVALAHLKDGLSPRRMVDIVRHNEGDEFLSYFKDFPEFAPLYEEIKRRYEDFVLQVGAFYNGYKGIADQKSFALKVKGSPMATICFSLRAGKGTIREIIAGSHIKLVEKWLRVDELDLPLLLGVFG